MFKFFTGKTPQEKINEWKRTVKKEEREIEKQIRGIDLEEKKIQNSLKTAAHKQDVSTCKMFAREIIRARKSKNKLFTSKAQLNSLLMQMQQQLSTIKITSSLKKSADIMKLVNNLIKIPEMTKAMKELSREMMKVFLLIQAGIIDEMVQDTLGLDDEDIEEEADYEVEKVLFELTDGLMGEAGNVGRDLNIVEISENEEIEKRLNALMEI